MLWIFFEIDRFWPNYPFELFQGIILVGKWPFLIKIDPFHNEIASTLRDVLWVFFEIDRFYRNCSFWFIPETILLSKNGHFWSNLTFFTSKLSQLQEKCYEFFRNGTFLTKIVLTLLGWFRSLSFVVLSRNISKLRITSNYKKVFLVAKMVPTWVWLSTQKQNFNYFQVILIIFLI